MMRWMILTAAALTTACGTEYGLDQVPPYVPPVADPIAMERAAADEGFALMHRDIALHCEHHAADDRGGCEARQWTADGPTPVGDEPVSAAFRLDDSRIVMNTLDNRIIIREGGSSTTIAEKAVGLLVGDDTRRIVYARFDADQVEPGVVLEWVVHDIANGVVRPVFDDPRDTRPYIVPESHDLLFTSTRSGVPALWRLSADGTTTQLTNVGVTRVGEGFTPLPSRDLIWLDPTTAVFSARYGTSQIWTLDIETGEARAVAPGRNPQFDDQGRVVVIDDRNPTMPRAAVLDLGGR